MIAIFSALLATAAGAQTILKHSLHGPQASGWGPAGVVQHSGYITVDGSYQNGSHLFYWMFEAQNSPKTAPLALWLTGGPGCSGELALFFENGPYTLNNVTNKVMLNPFSWNKNANLLYVDNPAGTGFSVCDYTRDYVTNEQEMAKQLLTFIVEFLDMYPQYANLNFTVFGESYGGKYVPAIAKAIVDYNNGAPATPIKLRSIGIGDGWSDPKLQYPGYYEFAKNKGFINVGEELAFEALSDACQALIDAGLSPIALVECQLYMSSVLGAISAAVGFEVNPYDVRIPCKVPGLCYDFSAVTALMNDATLQQAIGVKPNTQWAVCDNEVHTLLMGDWLTDLAADLPAVLAAGVRVLVYNGDEDFICNAEGSYDWVSTLNWSGQGAFNKAPVKQWLVNGKAAGTSQSASGLTFLTVKGAGHMVPHDQPAAALQLFNTMLTGAPF